MAKQKFEISNDALDVVSSAYFSEKRGRGRPRKEDVIHEEGPSAQKGLNSEYTRNTFIISKRLLERLDNYVVLRCQETQRIMTKKEALEILLTMALDSEEKRLAKKGIEILQKPKK